MIINYHKVKIITDNYCVARDRKKQKEVMHMAGEYWNYGIDAKQENALNVFYKAVRSLGGGQGAVAARRIVGDLMIYHNRMNNVHKV